MRFLAVPKRNSISYKTELRDILRFLLKEDILSGKHVSEFENCLANYINMPYVITTSSGSFSLFLILKALGLQEGDEIILPAFTFYTVPEVISELGLKPIFIDIKQETLNIDISQIENKINDKTKAIIVTHLLGQPVDINEILMLRDKYGIFIIEDCAHSFGAKYENKMVGSLGDATFFSFGIGKPLSTFGGGAVAVRDSQMNTRVRELLKDYPLVSRKDVIKEIIFWIFLNIYINRIVYTLLGWPLSLIADFFNLDLMDIHRKFRKKGDLRLKRCRPTNIQCFLGNKLLKQIDEINNKRFENARILINYLKINGISYQEYPSLSIPIYMMFAVWAKKKDRLFKLLLKSGIDSTKIYMFNCTNKFDMQERFMNTEKALDEVLFIHISHLLSRKDTSYIASVLVKNRHLIRQRKDYSEDNIVNGNPQAQY